MFISASNENTVNYFTGFRVSKENQFIHELLAYTKDGTNPAAEELTSRRWWYSGLAFGYMSLGSQVQSPNIRWPLFILWYYCRVAKRLPKLLSYCPQTELTMLYVSEAVVAISLSCSQHIQEGM